MKQFYTIKFLSVVIILLYISELKSQDSLCLSGEIIKFECYDNRCFEDELISYLPINSIHSSMIIEFFNEGNDTIYLPHIFSESDTSKGYWLGSSSRGDYLLFETHYYWGMRAKHLGGNILPTRISVPPKQKVLIQLFHKNYARQALTENIPSEVVLDNMVKDFKEIQSIKFVYSSKTKLYENNHNASNSSIVITKAKRLCCNIYICPF